MSYCGDSLEMPDQSRASVQTNRMELLDDVMNWFSEKVWQHSMKPFDDITGKEGDIVEIKTKGSYTKRTFNNGIWVTMEHEQF